jgi:hypothetical protein
MEDMRLQLDRVGIPHGTSPEWRPDNGWSATPYR